MIKKKKMKKRKNNSVFNNFWEYLCNIKINNFFEENGITNLNQLNSFSEIEFNQFIEKIELNSLQKEKLKSYFKKVKVRFDRLIKKKKQIKKKPFLVQ